MTFLKEIVQIEKGRKYNLLEENVKGSIRVFQANDFRNENKPLFTLDKEGVFANEDEIMLVWDGSVGQMGFGRSGYVGSTMVKLNVKDKKQFYPFYIYRFLQTKSEYLKRKATGATIMHINRRSLEQLEIPDLDLDSQQYIANILSKAEILIDKRKESIHLLDEFLKSTFLEMFGDPINNPKGWGVTTLESLCERIVDCPHETPRYEGYRTDFYCVRSSDIEDGYINLSETKCVSYNTYVHRIMRHEPQTGEVIYTREGGRLGNAARIPNGEKICLGQRMMLFIADINNSNNEFICALLNTISIRRLVTNLSGGGAAPRINIGQLRVINTIKPPLELQNSFAQIVAKTETLKTQYQQSLQELENLYGSLSQRAFRGELSIKED
jgi:type I restriction enzyme S subunit